MTRRTRVLGGMALTLVGLASLYTCHGDAPPSAPTDAVALEGQGPRIDVAAPGTVVFVGAGDIASCTSSRDEATAGLLDGVEGTVVALGDNAYTAGSVAQYADCYGPTWGRHLARTRPVPGDRDYSTSGAAGYFGYFGAAAGDPARGYYSYDAGGWHVVVLNSTLGTSATSAQVQWLEQDLSANGKVCTLAMWHKPRFSSAKDNVNEFEALWDALYAAGADVVLNAHYMNYERFAPQKPDGTLDPVNGIRQFVVGTGGAGSSPWKVQRANVEAQATGVHGVLMLTLGPTGYDWEFLPIPGQTFTDAGSATCSGASAPPEGDPASDSIPTPVARPGTDYQADEGAAVAFDGSASSDSGGNTPLTYAWSFGDDGTGSGATPSHAYAASGAYTVTLTVTNSLGAASEPATTTATIANVAPTVNAGADLQLAPGGLASLSIALDDPGGVSDAPWTFAVDWGDGGTSSGTHTSLTTPIDASHVYATAGTYTARVTVTDKDGGAGTDDVVATVSGTSTGPQVLIAVGDLASCSNNTDEATARLADNMAGTIMTIGDNAYEDASAADYASCYQPTWGRHKARTWAQLGNHEYYTGTADPTFDYFGDRAGPRGKGYYSFDLGDWHIIVLNDNRSFVPYKAGSAQEQWLRADLAANTKQCTIAVWHEPYYYSSNTSTTRYTGIKVLVDHLYAAGVEILLTGHRHFYERFAPQDPLANRDDARGIREFIVGTGGRGFSTVSTIAPNSEARGLKVFGVLKLTLHADRYDWQFVPIAGQSFTDAGSGTCH